MRKKRYNYSSEEKVIILKRHLVGRETVSDLCDEYQLQPNRFHDWQKQFFEKGAAAFAAENKNSKKVEEQRIHQLEEEIASETQGVDVHDARSGHRCR